MSLRDNFNSGFIWKKKKKEVGRNGAWEGVVIMCLFCRARNLLSFLSMLVLSLSQKRSKKNKFLSNSFFQDCACASNLQVMVYICDLQLLSSFGMSVIRTVSLTFKGNSQFNINKKLFYMDPFHICIWHFIISTYKFQATELRCHTQEKINPDITF